MMQIQSKLGQSQTRSGNLMQQTRKTFETIGLMWKMKRKANQKEQTPELKK
jgi:hypothetical protein